MKKIIPIIVIIMSSTAVLSAQDFRYDAGIAGGISCYMGVPIRFRRGIGRVLR